MRLRWILFICLGAIFAPYRFYGAQAQDRALLSYNAGWNAAIDAVAVWLVAAAAVLTIVWALMALISRWMGLDHDNPKSPDPNGMFYPGSVSNIVYTDDPKAEKDKS